jgi:hypothetical protein
MTAQSISCDRDDSASRERDQVALARSGKRSALRCARGGAVGTHYLTCPGLRLPPGYRLGPGSQPTTGRPGGGPDHPDWPCPPRQ